MKEKDISPTIWKSDEAYALYLEFIDRKGDPVKQAEITINTLFDIAEAADCGVDEVFEILTGAELIQLLRERRLSPWILLHSVKFSQFFATTLPEERIIIESIIRPKYWAEKFQKNPNSIELMRKYTKELNL